MELSERTEQARQKLKQALDANPEIKQAFKEALDETRLYFARPEVIQEMSATISQVKAAFDTGKFKEIVDQFKERNGLSGDTKLTGDIRKKLAEELANGIFGKK